MRVNHWISTKLLLITLLTSSALCQAEGQTTSQQLHLTVPKVALVSLDKTQYAFSFKANEQTSQQVAALSVSSNSPEARLEITAQNIPADIAVQAHFPDGLCSRVDSKGTTFSCHIGLTRIKALPFSLTASRKPNASPGTYHVNIHYQLSN